MAIKTERERESHPCDDGFTNDTTVILLSSSNIAWLFFELDSCLQLLIIKKCYLL